MVNLCLQRWLRRFSFFILIPSECGCNSLLSKQSKTKSNSNKTEKKNGWVMMNTTAYPGTYRKTKFSNLDTKPISTTLLFLVIFGPSRPQALLFAGLLLWACLSLRPASCLWLSDQWPQPPLLNHIYVRSRVFKKTLIWSLLSLFFFLNWSILDLRHCVSFSDPVIWVSDPVNFM